MLNCYAWLVACWLAHNVLEPQPVTFPGWKLLHGTDIYPGFGSFCLLIQWLLYENSWHVPGKKNERRAVQKGLQQHRFPAIRKGECKKSRHVGWLLSPRSGSSPKTPLILQLWRKLRGFYCTDEQRLSPARSVLVSHDSIATFELLFVGVPGCRGFFLFFHEINFC